ncbi:MAG: amidohydrolase family protein [Pseudomonadales bacterium]|nr:amidohydrolase family protein [Pseudomonadales bacterium]
MYDLLIENARVCDGTGRASFQGSVAVRDGQIVAVSDKPRSGEAARRRIDAEGQVVAPGFIDPHTHYDAQVAWDPLLTCSPWHGVTTVMMGNCGVGVAPLQPSMRDAAMADLVNVEAIPLDVMQKGIDWCWESFPEYLDFIQSRGVGINVASMVPLTPLRQFVMADASLERAANADEITTMTRIFREAVRAGAFGWSATFLDNHVGYRGRPIACRNASPEELRALCTVMREERRGVIEVAINQPRLGSVSDEGFELLSRLVNDSRRPVTYLVLINSPDDPLSYRSAVDRLKPILGWDRCVPQITAKPLSVQFDLRTPFPLGIVKAFHRVLNRPHEEQLALYRDPAFRSEVRSGIAEQTVFSGLFDRIRPLLATNDAVQALADTKQSIAEIARTRQADPVDTWFEIAIEGDLEVVFDFKAANFEPEGVRNLLRDGRFLVGLSDGGAHLSQLCDAGYATYLLGRWVREVPTLSLEEAVRNLTSIPADFFGIARRGRLLPGHHADLVVFDPDTVHAETPDLVGDLPGGAKRLVARARGVAATIVAGNVLYRDGQYEGGLPGSVLRSGDT